MAVRFCGLEVGVQVPSACQPEEAPAWSCVALYTFLVPTKLDWKVSARFTVSTFPDPDADDLLASTVHWLFCNVPVAPSATGPIQAVAASFIRYKAFAARL